MSMSLSLSLYRTPHSMLRSLKVPLSQEEYHKSSVYRRFSVGAGFIKIHLGVFYVQKNFAGLLFIKYFFAGLCNEEFLWFFCEWKTLCRSSMYRSSSLRLQHIEVLLQFFYINIFCSSSIHKISSVSPLFIQMVFCWSSMLAVQFL